MGLVSVSKSDKYEWLIDEDLLPGKDFSVPVIESIEKDFKKTVKKYYHEHKDCCVFCKYSRHTRERYDDWDNILCCHPDELDKGCYVEAYGICKWFAPEEA